MTNALGGGRMRPRGGRERGIGLIEILLAVVLISIGFLAAARMQLEGMRFSQSAYFRSQAYFLASEMIDRMRANVEGVSNGDYDDASIAAVTSDPGCANTACMPSDIAKQDLHDWRAAIIPDSSGSGVVGALPSTAEQAPTAQILPQADNTFLIRLTWPEVIAGESGTETLEVRFTSQSL